jgi:hypothetical protein
VKTEALAKVEWLGEVDTTADEAMAGEKRAPRRIVASEWLAEKFAEKREWLSEDLFHAARADGISRDAIFEAKRLLDLPRARRDMGQDGSITYIWWVPPGWKSPLSQDDDGCDSTTVGTEDVF